MAADLLSLTISCINDGSSVTVQVSPSATIHDVKVAISGAREDEIPPVRQWLLLSGKELPDHATVSSSGVTSESSLVMVERSDPGAAFGVFIKMLTGRVLTVSGLHKTDTLRHLKQRIQDQVGIPPDQQRLLFAGRAVDDNSTFEEACINRDSTLHLILRLRSRPMFVTDAVERSIPALNASDVQLRPTVSFVLYEGGTFKTHGGGDTNVDWQGLASLPSCIFLQRAGGDRDINTVYDPETWENPSGVLLAAGNGRSSVLAPDEGRVVAATMSIDESACVISITPDADLEPDTEYEAILTSDVPLNPRSSQGKFGKTLSDIFESNAITRFKTRPA